MKLFGNLFNNDFETIYSVLKGIFKYSSEELIITDKNFNIIDYDYNTSQITNKNTKKTLFDITGEFFNQNIRINVENFKNSEKDHILLKLLFNNEYGIKNIPVDIHICKIRNKQNKIKGYYIIIKDITREIQNRIQTETFVNILSHDLKHPILANIQILDLILNNKFGYLGDELKTVMEELSYSCRFMNYMTDNLLIKYKNEFNLYELQKQRYSVVKLIKEKCSSLEKLLARKKQTTELCIEGEIPDIDMDVNEIGKVINNLIVNASEESGENSKILIIIKGKEKNVDVSVRDFGYPKKQERINDIFEEYSICYNKFRRVGFGLEFYNCKKIIEAHNGAININTETPKKKGNLITFSLPV